MSYVTNIILHIGILEHEEARIKEVNAFFGEHDNPLVGLSEQPLPPGWYGGTKYLECNVYVGAFNHLDLDGFLAHLGRIHWEDPGTLQVFIKGDPDDRFRMVFGVEEEDPRLWERDRLLRDAQDWLEDLERLLPNGGYQPLLHDWQQRYNALYHINEEDENTVDGSAAPVIEDAARLIE